MAIEYACRRVRLIAEITSDRARIDRGADTRGPATASTRFCFARTAGIPAHPRRLPCDTRAAGRSSATARALPRQAEAKFVADLAPGGTRWKSALTSAAATCSAGVKERHHRPRRATAFRREQPRRRRDRFRRDAAAPRSPARPAFKSRRAPLAHRRPPSYARQASASRARRRPDPTTAFRSKRSSVPSASERNYSLLGRRPCGVAVRLAQSYRISVVMAVDVRGTSPPRVCRLTR